MWQGHCQFSAFPTWGCHHPLPLLEEAGLEAVSGTKVVRLVSRHQFLHWLQNHTQLVGRSKRQRYRMKMGWTLVEAEPTQVQALVALPEFYPDPDSTGSAVAGWERSGGGCTHSEVVEGGV